MSGLSFADFYATLFVWGFLGLTAAIVTALACLTFADSPAGQNIARHFLGKQLAGTRMWSMLEHRDISPLAYVDHASVPQLRAQLRICRNCPKHEMCDETLGYVGWRKRNYGFCPNRQAMDRFEHARAEIVNR